MTTARGTSLPSKAWRAGIVLLLVVGACSNRRQLSLFAPAPEARDASGDGDEAHDPERSRRCDSPSDCTDERPFCEDERCVQCLTTGDCDPGQSCRFEDHTCVATCFDESDCVGGGRPICAVAAGVCVECVERSNCEESEPLCDSSTGRCVECLEHEDCGERRCHPDLHECVDCVNDGDCEESEECARGECQR